MKSPPKEQAVHQRGVHSPINCSRYRVLEEQECVFSEFDASIQMGSGLIAVAGPPGCGKTTGVLQYLSLREEQFRATSRSLDDSFLSSSSPSFFMHYETASSFSSDILFPMASRIRNDEQRYVCREKIKRKMYRDERAAAAAGTSSRTFPRDSSTITPLSRTSFLNGSSLPFRMNRKRSRADSSLCAFTSAVVSWLRAHENGSELHLVVDDADCLKDDNAAISSWLDGCLFSFNQSMSVRVHDGDGHGDADGWCFQNPSGSSHCSSSGSSSSSSSVSMCGDHSAVFLWIISQIPRRLPSCFRLFLFKPPSTKRFMQWVHSDYESWNCNVESDRAVDSCRPRLTRKRIALKESSSDPILAETSLSNVYRNVLAQYVCQAVEYYHRHQPMRSSLVTHDIRLLLQRVYVLLPGLLNKLCRESRNSPSAPALPLPPPEQQQEPSDKQEIVSENRKGNQSCEISSTTEAASRSAYSSAEEENNGLPEESPSQSKEKIKTGVTNPHFLPNHAQKSDAPPPPTSFSSLLFPPSNGGLPWRAHALHWAKAWRSTASHISPYYLPEEKGKEEEGQVLIDPFSQESDSSSSLTGEGGRGGEEDTLSHALLRMGYTAVLLALSAFYAGAVPLAQQKRALFTSDTELTTRRKTSIGASSKTTKTLTSVLVSSTFSFSVPHLEKVYRALLALSTLQVDPLEFASASWACTNVLPRLVSCGLLSPSRSGASGNMIPGSTSYFCWIPSSTALLLGDFLGIHLYELLPL